MPEDPISPAAPPSPAALEGRLLAHRQLLAALIRTLPEAARAELMTLLQDRSVLSDGQEDPGAVPTDGLAVGLALADEFRLLTELARETAT